MKLLCKNPLCSRHCEIVQKPCVETVELEWRFKEGFQCRVPKSELRSLTSGAEFCTVCASAIRLHVLSQTIEKAKEIIR